MTLKIPACPLCKTKTETIEAFREHILTHNLGNVAEMKDNSGNIWILSETEISPPGVVVIDVRDLIDGDVPNPPENIIPKIKAGLWLYDNKYKLGYRCRMGVNRSVSVAAAVISLTQNIAYDNALDIVRKNVPRANPYPSMIASVKLALSMMKNDR